MTSDSRQNAIRDLAYAMWEQAGCPCGDGINFWLDAEKELDSASVECCETEAPVATESKKKSSSLPAPPLKIARAASQSRKKAG